MHIFISYRRDDSSVHARLLHEELLRYFGADEVFMDVHDIEYGDDFADRIGAKLERADVVLVVVGPKWGELLERRARSDDWVRHEVERALALRAAGRLRVLPVFVGGASWAGVKLPPALGELRRLNALSLEDRRFDEDLRTVVEAIRRRPIWDELVELVRGRRARLAGLAVGLAAFAAGWVALLDALGIDTRLASLTMALADVGRGDVPWSGRVVLLAIDPGTEAAVGRPFDATWRAEHAQVVAQAASAGARTLAFDMVFNAAAPEAANRALADAAAQAEARLPVVAGVKAMDGDAPALLPLLRDHVHWGIACAGERLGLARSMPLVVQRGEDGPLRPALALAAFAGGGAASMPKGAALAEQVVVQVRADGAPAVVDYHSAQTIDRVQPGCPAIAPGDRVASQVFDPARLPALDTPPRRIAYERVWRGEPEAVQQLRGRIVLVGLLKPGVDRFAVPGGGERWGAELVAAQIDALVRGEAIRSAGVLAHLVVGAGSGLAGAGVVIALRRRARQWRMLALGAAMLALAAAVVLWYRVEGQLLDLAYGWIALALGAWTARRMLKEAHA